MLLQSSMQVSQPHTFVIYSFLRNPGFNYCNTPATLESSWQYRGNQGRALTPPAFLGVSNVGHPAVCCWGLETLAIYLSCPSRD